MCLKWSRMFWIGNKLPFWIRFFRDCLKWHSEFCSEYLLHLVSILAYDAGPEQKQRQKCIPVEAYNNWKSKDRRTEAHQPYGHLIRKSYSLLHNVFRTYLGCWLHSFGLPAYFSELSVGFLGVGCEAYPVWWFSVFRYNLLILFVYFYVRH